MTGHIDPARPAPAPSGTGWCAGCGYRSVFSAIERLLHRNGQAPERSVFLCGAGCPSLLPDPLRHFVFQGASGSAAALALGVTAANPALDVWTLSTDGNALADGAAGLLDLIRHDSNATCLVFRDRLAGRTDRPQREDATALEVPGKAIAEDTNACRLAIGAGGRFVARVHEDQGQALETVLSAAQAHPGTGFVEVLQQCLARQPTLPPEPEDRLELEHGAPMIFGRERVKGLRRCATASCGFEIVDLTRETPDNAGLAIHDERDAALAFRLAGLPRPAFPIVTGVLYRTEATDARPAIALEADLQARRAALARAMQDAPTWEGTGA